MGFCDQQHTVAATTTVSTTTAAAVATTKATTTSFRAVVPTTAAVAAAATAAAAVSTTTAATAAAGALRGFVDTDSTTVETENTCQRIFKEAVRLAGLLLIVHGLHSSIGIFLIGETDEAESTTAICVAIFDNDLARYW